MAVWIFKLFSVEFIEYGSSVQNEMDSPGLTIANRIADPIQAFLGVTVASFLVEKCRPVIIQVCEEEITIRLTVAEISMS